MYEAGATNEEDGPGDDDDEDGQRELTSLRDELAALRAENRDIRRRLEGMNDGRDDHGGEGQRRARKIPVNEPSGSPGAKRGGRKKPAGGSAGHGYPGYGNYDAYGYQYGSHYHRSDPAYLQWQSQWRQYYASQGDRKPDRTGWGLLLMIAGGYLTLTGILAIFGIPIFLVGLYWFVKSWYNSGEDRTAGHPGGYRHDPSPTATPTPKWLDEYDRQAGSPHPPPPAGAAGTGARASEADMPSRRPAPGKGSGEKAADMISGMSRFEFDLGSKWLARLGILVLVVGIGFFVKYAIDAGYIGPVLRLLMGLALGAGLVALGQWAMRFKDYETWARTLTGGGLAATYFITYAAYHFPEYRDALGMGLGLDIALLSVVVLAAMFLSLKDDSKVIAGEAFFLGYLTSLLSLQFGALTLTYALLLAVGLVVIGYRKKWPEAGIGGMVATYGIFFLWLMGGGGSTLTGMLFLVAYFGAFSAQTMLLSLDAPGSEANQVLTVLNSLFFAVLGMVVLAVWAPGLTGLLLAALAGYHLVAALAARHAGPEEASGTHLHIGLVALTLSAPFMLDGGWITAAWAAEALSLFAVHLRTKDQTVLNWGYLVAFFAGAKVFVVDVVQFAWGPVQGTVPAWELVPIILVIALQYASWLVLKEAARESGRKEGDATRALAWSASALMVLTVLIATLPFTWWGTAFLAALAPAMFLVSTRGHMDFRHMSYGVTALMFLKVLSYDMWFLPGVEDGGTLVYARLLAVVPATAALYVMAWLLERRGGELKGDEKSFPEVLTWAALVFSMALVMMELSDYVISIGWSLAGAALVFAGFSLKRRDLRLQGLAAFALTSLKVFLYDTSQVDALFRTASFLVLGAILLLVSFLYVRYRDRLMEYLGNGNGSNNGNGNGIKVY